MSINYLLLIFFTFLFDSFFGLKTHLDQIFSAEVFEFSNDSYYYSTVFSHFFANFLMIFFYVIIIDKANKILDFALTNFFIHILLTTFIKSFPLNYFWWIINGSICGTITVISEYISLKLDQKEIKLTSFK